MFFLSVDSSGGSTDPEDLLHATRHSENELLAREKRETLEPAGVDGRDELIHGRRIQLGHLDFDRLFEVFF